MKLLLLIISIANEAAAADPVPFRPKRHPSSSSKPSVRRLISDHLTAGTWKLLLSLSTSPEWFHGLTRLR
ncbi:hypothetical protein PanWU01x14_316690, partial [Parasponia andersonii]